MKNLSFLILALLSFNSFALDTEVKGFVALNTLTFEKVDHREQTLKMGIGTIDLKFYFNHEDFGAKIKLDLDGRLEESNNLYEEALITWNPQRDWKFSMGKGKIRFHQMSYGILESHYGDGGSILGTTHGLRDQDRKIMTEVAYGGYKKGFRNYFSIYADAAQPSATNNNVGYTTDNPTDPGKGNLVYSSEKEIDTKQDWGISNKFEFYPRRGFTVGIGGLYRDRDIDYNENWALDFSGKYKSGDWEIIWEYVYAYVSNNPNDRFAVEHQHEQLGQFQFLYQMTNITKFQFNTEFALVNTQQYNKDNLPNGIGNKSPNYGDKVETNNYKAEVGVLWKLAQRVNFKVGFLYERKYEWKAQASNNYIVGYEGFKDGWEIGSGINFWF
ncbi:hypothetical protein [Halobacteriovorax sp. HLS]|uniref:hypothetical protein n=1 Tax=Halobacteriovorax sp. HLS TaxID=2234000 RepID=UPI000FDADA0A|nr:hypothetical protein [Halobacteriovorax sp. HLS]